MAAHPAEHVESALDIFTNVTHKPEVFLSVNNDVVSKLQNLTKNVYDITKTIEDRSESEALPELLLAGFDDEQVWQELELQNSAAIDSLLAGVNQLTTTSNLSFRAGLQNAPAGDSTVDTGSEEENEEDEEEEMDDMEESEDEDEDLPLESGFTFGEGSSGDESEEEKELKRLLDKAAAADREQEKGSESDDEEEDGSLFGDNDELQEEPKSKQKLDGREKSQKKEPSKSEKKRKSVVDDKFFKLADLESFLDREDAKEDRKRRREEMGEESDESSEDEEDIDVFADIPSEDEGQSARNMRYKDFFDPPDEEKKPGKKSQSENESDEVGEEESEEGEDEEEDDDDMADEERDEGQDSDEEGSGDEATRKTSKRNLLGDDSDSSEDDGRTKSTFEQRQERLAKKIANLEKTNLADKPWQLVGEVAGSARPENSLLQEDLDFEQQTRLAPEITEETTKSLEDIIKQRIKDQAWDDVERKVKPVDAPFEYKKRIVLDQEKSKKSLGEIYEEEYLKQAEKDKEEKEDPQHEDIRKSMTALFIQLDALANFHYTPKPAAADVKVISNLPTVAVEEVAPVSVSQADMLAPEEIKEKGRKELKGDTEKTKEDKKAERRTKKKEKRIRIREKEKRQKLVEKLNPGLGNKYAKQKAMDDLEKQSKGTKSAVTVIKEGKSSTKSDLTSSSKFFSRLQDQVTSRIAEAKGTKKKKKKETQNNSAKLKL